ncbi:hypothetical protein PR048_003117 [Dryococelus australis]|uniref:C2H2-type domain-containing protein n=1 Tax=Dryococelus australis TaxID=614101 RepID=A0ABQ9IM75_9NEOP|nr:hypothetical protein PR048_003117 [Dryococelus australis]
MTNSGGKLKHRCSFCGKCFLANKDLKKHIRTHTGEKPYECNDCGAKFSQAGALKNHIVSRHNLISADSFFCHFCNKSFPIKERLRLHLRVHTGERPYRCKHCPKTFARGGQLLQHLRSHSGTRPFKCEHCNSSFTYANNLKQHIKKHLGERDHICNVCGKRFLRRDGLQKHLTCYHGDIKAFHCNICNKNLKGHLMQHFRTHRNEKPHACTVCDATFAQRSQLTVHMRVHSGEKPYQCQICKQTFAHSTVLKMHVRRHTGEKPFKCLLCPSTTFVQLPHLKKHMLCVHKTNKPYLCVSCRKFFKTKLELETHQQESSSCVAETGGKVDSKTDPKTSKHMVTSASSSQNCKKRAADDEVKPVMALDKMRLLLAILLKKISTPSNLDVIGFGRHLIDDVLCKSIERSGRKPCYSEDLDEGQRLKQNIEILLEWTVPKQYMEKFRRERRSTEELLEELTT